MKLLTGMFLLSFMCSSLYSIAEQSAADCSQDARKKEEIQVPTTARQKVQAFLANNAFALISLACTLTTMYMSYYFNNETLKMSRASFVLDRGVVALKNLWMIAAGDCDKYKSLVQATKVCA